MSQRLSPTMPKEEKVRRVLEILRGQYPEHTALNHETPFQLLIATILSAQCTDKRVNKVTPDLFDAYPTPEALAAANLDEVKEIIRSTGFYNQKAKSIVGAARTLVEEFDGELPRTIKELTRCRGVARKTANVVLHEAWGIREGIAVDTHVKRLAGRLGLTEETRANKIERDLMAITPQEDWGAITLLLIGHGREVCKSRSPRCENCDLLPLCPHGQEHVA